MSLRRFLLTGAVIAVVVAAVDVTCMAGEVSSRGTQIDVLPVPVSDAVKWPWCYKPDLKIGKWWYKAPPRIGQDVDLWFEIRNVGRGIACGPILWEVTCHNWGFWNPVLNRLAVSYSRPVPWPGRSRSVHLRFLMTQEMHNLMLMADPSDHLGPPDNPPFGQKAVLCGLLDLKDGHIKESDELNNSKWVCIKVFPLKPVEITKIAIPVVNPYPGLPTEVVIQMDKDLALPEGVELGVPADVTPVAAVDTEPPIQPVEPGQVIAKFVFDPEKDEEEVVLLARLLENAILNTRVRFKVLGTATTPDGEPMVAAVTVVLETEMQPDEEVAEE